MNKLLQVLASLSLAILVAFGGVVFNACSDGSPVAADKSDQDLQSFRILKMGDLGGDRSLRKVVSVSQMVTAAGGGTLHLDAGQDPDLLAQINDPAVDDATLYNTLNAAYPLSATVLRSLLEQRADDMQETYLYGILQLNSPLRESVLQALLAHADDFSDGNLTMLLVTSSPLPPSIVAQVPGLNLPLSYYDWIMMQQGGTPTPDSLKNIGTVGASVSLQILPGAISSDASITISTDDAELAGDVFLTFGPHGLTFSPPAILNLEASGLNLFDVDPATIDIYYDNPETGLWEPMQRDAIIVDQNEGRIQVINAQLPHFSRYAIGTE